MHWYASSGAQSKTRACLGQVHANTASSLARLNIHWFVSTCAQSKTKVCLSQVHANTASSLARLRIGMHPQVLNQRQRYALVRCRRIPPALWQDWEWVCIFSNYKQFKWEKIKKKDFSGIHGHFEEQKICFGAPWVPDGALGYANLFPNVCLGFPGN